MVMVTMLGLVSGFCSAMTLSGGGGTATLPRKQVKSL